MFFQHRLRFGLSCWQLDVDPVLPVGKGHVNGSVDQRRPTVIGVSASLPERDVISVRQCSLPLTASYGEKRHGSSRGERHFRPARDAGEMATVSTLRRVGMR